MAAEILRKITIKNAGGFTAVRLKELVGAVKAGESVDLLKIIGIANSAKTGQTEKGEFTKLLGEFHAVDLTTGDLYQSAACILPEFVGSVLGGALKSSGGAVEFAVKIAAKRDDSSATGYVYAITPLSEAKVSEPMQNLMQLAGIDPNAAPALPPPAEPAKPAAKSGKGAK